MKMDVKEDGVIPKLVDVFSCEKVYLEYSHHLYVFQIAIDGQSCLVVLEVSYEIK